MRNYVQLVFAGVADAADNFAVYGWQEDNQQAADFLAAVFPGYDPTLFHTVQESWYWKLSKFELQTMLNLTPPVVRTFMESETPKNWNSNNPAFSVSPRVDGSLPATKPVSARNKGGRISMSLLDYLERLLVTWSTPGLPPPAVQAPQRWLERLRAIIDSYSAGKITPTQVYAFLNDVDFSR